MRAPRVPEKEVPMNRHYIAELPDSMASTAAIFSALGDPVRQRILLLFEPGEELSIKEIAELFTLSRTAVVHHLSVLERAGILVQRRDGKSAPYSFRPAVVLEAVTALRNYIMEEFPETRNRPLEEDSSLQQPLADPFESEQAGTSLPAGKEDNFSAGGKHA